MNQNKIIHVPSVEYYIYDADSTSEASARALGRIIDGRKSDIAVDAWISENRWYYEGSEYYFEANNTVDGVGYNGTLHANTKTITVLNASDLVRPIEDFYDRSYDLANSYANNGTSCPNGCIELAVKCYIYGAKDCGWLQI